jgi:hypothetical protein
VADGSLGGVEEIEGFGVLGFLDLFLRKVNLFPMAARSLAGLAAGFLSMLVLAGGPSTSIPRECVRQIQLTLAAFIGWTCLRFALSVLLFYSPVLPPPFRVDPRLRRAGSLLQIAKAAVLPPTKGFAGDRFPARLRLLATKVCCVLFNLGAGVFALWTLRETHAAGVAGGEGFRVWPLRAALAAGSTEAGQSVICGRFPADRRLVFGVAGGYFMADALAMVTAPGEERDGAFGAAMLLHHLYMFMAFTLPALAPGSFMTWPATVLLVAELSSPLMQLRWWLEQTGRRSKRPCSAYALNGLAFYAIFAVVRIAFTPLLFAAVVGADAACRSRAAAAGAMGAFLRPGFVAGMAVHYGLQVFWFARLTGKLGRWARRCVGRGAERRD